jgi:hypothetical protein
LSFLNHPPFYLLVRLKGKGPVEVEVEIGGGLILVGKTGWGWKCKMAVDELLLVAAGSQFQDPSNLVFELMRELDLDIKREVLWLDV